MIAYACTRRSCGPTARSCGKRDYRGCEDRAKMDPNPIRCAEEADVFIPEPKESEMFEALYTQFLALKENMLDFWKWRSLGL